MKPSSSSQKQIFEFTTSEAFDSRLTAVNCKTMAADFGSEEPLSFVYKNEIGEIFALTNKDNSPQIHAELKQQFFDSDLKLNTYKEKHIRFQPQLVGPFQLFEMAAQASCDSFYKSKLKLIKKFKLKNSTEKFYPHPVRFNVGIQPEFLSKTYNQVVDCDFFKIDSGYYQLTPDFGKADIFSFAGQHFAYSAVKSVELKSLTAPYTLFFSGPFKSKQLAAKKACQLQLEHANRIIAEFKKSSELLKLHEVCPGTKHKNHSVLLGQISRTEPFEISAKDLNEPKKLAKRYPFLGEQFALESEKMKRKMASLKIDRKDSIPIFLQAQVPIWMIQSSDQEKSLKQYYYSDLNGANLTAQEVDLLGTQRGFSKEQMKQKICFSASKY